MKKPLLAVVGPTATGKTEVGVNLSQKIDGEVVSADSMLVYKGMDIGTAKPSMEERQGIPHHMIDVAVPTEDYSVARYQREARKVVAEIHNRNKIPVIVGGTGLYIRAVVDEYNFDVPGENREIRQSLLQQANEKGTQWLHRELSLVDPRAAERIHHKNVRRVIRALEVYKLTGKPFSSFQQAEYKSRPEYKVALFGLTMPREILYKRIEKRVDIMLEQGLVEEVQGLIKQGVKAHVTSMQGLGYKEIASYLAGELTLAQAVELIKRDTRRYAKRQLTWFKRDPRIIWFDMNKYNNIDLVADEIIKTWQEYNSTL
ncbi:tRNA (adenosine(37)-N6)-dimethylallyltransferase MiaA [Desulfofalx alkaliphila]|uniref:tRNA (adenosine(37)-N6)-dimethylallyltransferase MiaA n=1 Tax=Desulfofalx alkaliphila TaxID=105483 RepID=UPI0004E17959|nr:tRNA (adenosine(37)-N6)-dimethylallyltransferase MiaA [Desulfofalx alkaliphila]